MSISSAYNFGKYLIPIAHVFYSTPLTFCFVNLRPITKGHVLISPTRIVSRFSDLTEEESYDILLVAQKISGFLEKKYLKRVDICVQDGQEAGQTVPHIHIHLVPVGKEMISAVDSGNFKRIN